ncbi:sel1 repeat family protein [Halosquirtibacter xylanolyticus]|uniref:tetratricopeptide repeat protein n=1 Tax=Halosquirtibacter xylanolyticus TaxID=3374599 RepID=UPI00374859ED|nr:sel1 repeat family protein [Prolixibacteraceae bacterium]
MRWLLIITIAMSLLPVSSVRGNGATDRKSSLMVQRSRYVLYHSHDEIARKKALETIFQYAEQKDGYALNALGLIYMSGKGLPKDTIKASEMFAKASEQGMGDAMCNLAKLYRTGRGGVKQCDTMAFKYYKMAAEHNHRVGIYCVGRCYYKGKGTKIDFKKAYDWLTVGDQQGTVAASYLRGVCLYKGRGVEKKSDEGLKLIRTSLDEGYTRAEKFLKFNKIDY